MTLKLGGCVRVMYLLMCAKFHVPMTKSRRQNPFGGGGLRIYDDWISFKISSKFLRVQVLFLNQHVLNRLSLTADDWRQDEYLGLWRLPLEMVMLSQLEQNLVSSPINSADTTEIMFAIDRLGEVRGSSITFREMCSLVLTPLSS